MKVFEITSIMLFAMLAPSILLAGDLGAKKSLPESGIGGYNTAISEMITSKRIVIKNNSFDSVSLDSTLSVKVTTSHVNNQQTGCECEKYRFNKLKL